MSRSRFPPSQRQRQQTQGSARASREVSTEDELISAIAWAQALEQPATIIFAAPFACGSIRIPSGCDGLVIKAAGQFPITPKGSPASLFDVDAHRVTIRDLFPYSPSTSNMFATFVRVPSGADVTSLKIVECEVTCDQVYIEEAGATVSAPLIRDVQHTSVSASHAAPIVLRSLGARILGNFLGDGGGDGITVLGGDCSITGNDLGGADITTSSGSGGNRWSSNTSVGTKNKHATDVDSDELLILNAERIAEIEAVVDDLTTTQADLATAQADLATAQATLATAVSDIDTAQDDIAAAQASLATVVTDLGVAVADIDEAQDDIADLTAQIAATQDLGFFGDGVDGDLVASSGTTTLTKDTHYNDVTLSGTAQINTAGYRLFVKGTLDITNAGASAIFNSGGDGGNGADTTAGTAGAACVGVTLGASAAGGAGGAAGNAVAGGSVTVSMGGSGGIGGLGSGGGIRGAAGVATSAVNLPSRLTDDLRAAAAATYIGGGAGGGGGSSGTGGSTDGGGGGGGGGGVLFLRARTISRGASTAAGAIAATGGTGGQGFDGPAVTSKAASGGGGGGGGAVHLVAGTLIGAARADAISAAGGAGGRGGNATAAANGGGGGTGGNGGRIWIIVLSEGGVLLTSGAAGTAGSLNSGQTGGAGGAGGACEATL